MNRPSTEPEVWSCWPTPEQELLLKAALLQQEDALRAWTTWKSSVNFQQIDLGSYRLLPLLYSNLVRIGVSDPLMVKMKGVYRRSWYDNQLLFHSLGQVIRAFDVEGINTLVLKGSALALFYYRDVGLRPMDDFDIMIPPAVLSKGIELLVAMGWQPAQALPDFRVLQSHRHSWSFKDRFGRQLDLHWHLFHERYSDDIDREFWHGAGSVMVNGASTLALDPSDQLLHICAHGAGNNVVASIRWIADAMMVLQRCGTKIDWERINAQARTTRLTLHAFETLSYLSRNFGENVPAALLSALAKTHVSLKDRLLYRYETAVPGTQLLGGFWYHLEVYSVEADRQGDKGSIREVTRYLMRRWQLSHPLQIPRYVIWMIFSRFAKKTAFLLKSLFRRVQT